MPLRLCIDAALLCSASGNYGFWKTSQHADTLIRSSPTSTSWPATCSALYVHTLEVNMSSPSATAQVSPPAPPTNTRAPLPQWSLRVAGGGGCFGVLDLRWEIRSPCVDPEETAKDFLKSDRSMVQEVAVCLSPPLWTLWESVM